MTALSFCFWLLRLVFLSVCFCLIPPHILKNISSRIFSHAAWFHKNLRYHTVSFLLCSITSEKIAVQYWDVAFVHQIFIEWLLCKYVREWKIEINNTEKSGMSRFASIFILGNHFSPWKNIRYIASTNRCFRIHGISLILGNLFCLIKVTH